MTWGHLDKQMAVYAPQLLKEVKLSPEISKKLVTTMAAEVRFLAVKEKDAIRDATPIPVGDRLAELKAFQGWMDAARSADSSPFVTRAQILTQSYICFVYCRNRAFA